jgi:uncharacterized membrane protein YeaQ/YmgE (transglycosylase-associated protein family)
LDVIGIALLGLGVGELARFVMPGHESGRVVVTTALGIAGSLLGGTSGRLLGWYQDGEPASFLMALAGSILLLAVYSVWLKSREP